MRRSLIVSLAILLLVAAVGGGCETYNGFMVRRFQAMLAVAGADAAQGRWEEAAARIETISLQWEKECAWVQLWVNHAETDAVKNALRGLLTSLNARDSLSAALYYGECVENFAHLHHRDAFTLKNIL